MGSIYPCKLVRFSRVKVDRTTSIGQSINAYLKGETRQEDHVIHLLFSANRWEAAAQIKADIAAGITVIVDRYYYSGIVYSAAKQNPDLTLAWAREPDVGLPRPDVCIFLNISPEDAAKRGGFGLEVYENDNMQDRVRDLFKKLQRLPDGEDMHTVDAGGSMDEVECQVLKRALSSISAITDMSPLRKIEPWSEAIHVEANY